MPSTGGLGKALRLLRARHDLKQGEVAARAKVTQAMLSAYEHGQQTPTFKSLTAILNALGQDFHDLQEGLAQVCTQPAAPIQRECLGEALKLLRTQRGLTQTAVAREARLSKSTLSSYETGKYEPSFQSLSAVLDALKCDFHGLQEALLRVQSEGEVGPATSEGLHLEPVADRQILIAAFESPEGEGPTVYVQLHPGLRTWDGRGTVVLLPMSILEQSHFTANDFPAAKVP